MIDEVELPYEETKKIVLEVIQERENAQQSPQRGAVAGYAIAAVGALSLVNNLLPDSIKADIATKFSSFTQPFLSRPETQSAGASRTGAIGAYDKTWDGPSDLSGALPPFAPSTPVSPQPVCSLPLPVDIRTHDHVASEEDDI